jgi:starch phosphorylase
MTIAERHCTTSDPPRSAAVDQALLATVGTAPEQAGTADMMHAMASIARQQLSRRWVASEQSDHQAKARRVYYLSMEFLIGRTLGNALAALGLEGEMADAARAHAMRLEDLAAAEPDAALGNGGLGRLAACFLDSLATLGLPSYGYGIRYEFGMFAQGIRDGQQVESPDAWLEDGTPWEFPRQESYSVPFGGWVEQPMQALSGDVAPLWRPAHSVRAKAYDMVVPGHGTERVSTLRLWKALAPSQIDLPAFNAGDYARAARAKNESENISWVLYPNDSSADGRRLRLAQEFFFTSASLQDILARHLAEHGRLTNLAEQVAIHLNDTHPAVGVAELMRLLLDEHGFAWGPAWRITGAVFSYTNHTLMPEALETWPVALFQELLPRHLEIILRINHDLLTRARTLVPGDDEFLRRLSLIDESGERRVRMAHLAVVGSHKVNGVSALHSGLLVKTLFADFARLWPERFTNMTNGVTPRRWLAQANPSLARLIDARIGSGWRLELDQLQRLAPAADDPGFRQAFMAAKRANKERLAALIRERIGLEVDPASLFDVQVKRFHEYKRQLLNLLHVVARYQAMLAEPDRDWLPRTVVFAGKAASGYVAAKTIIHLIHDVAAVVNADARLAGRLKLAFLPNYGVSLAEVIMPAADLSEQISTAGTEASGTGNMKLALNGALTIGTDDGANIEIRERVGSDNIFIFGLCAAEVAAERAAGYQPLRHYEADARLKAVLDAIAGGAFADGDAGRYRALVDSLLWGGDPYFLLADFASYWQAHERVDAAFRDEARWSRMAIANVAQMGFFSSDRTIAEYARQIWALQPRS